MAKLKMTPEHYAYLRDRMAEVLRDRPTMGREYAAMGRSELRFRWDVMWACQLSKWVCDELYTYLNDDHIDSALRHIIEELEADAGEEHDEVA